VREHREGRHRVYQLNPAPLRAVASWLDPVPHLLEDELTSLKTFVEAEYVKETKQAAKRISKRSGKEMKKKFSICIGRCSANNPSRSKPWPPQELRR